MIILPTKQNVSPRYSYSVELAGVVFNMYFYWNTREAAWFLDISDKDGVLLLAGIRIVSGYSLLKQYSYITTLPQGVLFVIDTKNDPTTNHIDFDSFGERYQLVFATEEEIA